MKRVLFDIEANDLLDDVTTAHCLVLTDVDTGDVVSCTDSAPGFTPMREGLRILSEAEAIYGHNIIGYDLPVLQKLYPDFRWQGTVFDTLVMCRLLFAHIKDTDYLRARRNQLPGRLIGSHSIEAWGYRLKVKKDDYTGWCEENGIEDPWAEWRPEMQSYCEQDVQANVALLRYLRTRKPPKNPVSLEHDLAWYLTQQERNGWPLNFEAAVRLQAELAQRRQILEQDMIDHFGSWVEPRLHKGEVVEFTPKRNNSRYGYVQGAPACKLQIVEFNPGSRNHISGRLQSVYGWEPKEFTPSGDPKVDESTLKGLDVPIAEQMVEYFTIQKRLGQLAEGKHAWLVHMTDDRIQGGRMTGVPHIHHSASNVTITHRHRHSHPNLAQVPANRAPYGEACRSLFTVPPGWKMVGADASGLELRCLAHYMAKWDKGAYGKIILEGDVHTANQEALLSAVDGVTRDHAKTFIYAYLYGAGDRKLGSILLPTASEEEQRALGKKLRAAFEQQIPALGYLVDGVKSRVKKYTKAKKAPWIPGLDGRRVYVRHEHAALNTLLQSAGAIICKAWIREFDRRLCERFDTEPGGGWDHEWAALGWIHDEVQLAVRPDVAQEVGETVVDSIRHIEKVFDLRLPLDGEFSVGSNWSETH